MKDIYELLNEIDLDDKQFEEIEVTEFEKAKVKKALKESLNQKRKIWSWKKNIAAAVIIVGLSATTFGLTFPAYASDIPVIRNIFRLLDTGRIGFYEDYKKYSSEINMTEESSGIKITIKEAIFDGKSVTLTYALESNQDLGDDPNLHGLLDAKGSLGGSQSSQITKVDENSYVGLVQSNIEFRNQMELDHVNINWTIENITNQNNEEKIKGKWSFALSLDATENQTQIINQSAQQEGVKVNIEKISFTPMSFIVYYNQVISDEVRNKWDAVDMEIEIKDDLGNNYLGKGNGGAGERDGYNMHWSKTFEKLNPNATKLILTTHLNLYEYTSENHGSLEITKEGSKEILLPKKSGRGREKFTLDDIVIELKK
ncbi:DUF4179 domain-containing protein [Bacillus sp. FJAT-28004]|uniref:DUF4179 domain-containing protein n=1 Tax=Bacillus sp. FJAT-28004 TaxID=1679165 RepID=UPI0006B5AA81|nr:DUF4179 domain-containing protein [Bacillus sp. FJAT-28004]